MNVFLSVLCTPEDQQRMDFFRFMTPWRKLQGQIFCKILKRRHQYLFDSLLLRVRGDQLILQEMSGVSPSSFTPMKATLTLSEIICLSFLYKTRSNSPTWFMP